MASNEAARSTGSLAPIPRRQMSRVYRFLSPHQAAVLDAAAGRLAPGPEIGAVDVVSYVDRLLALVDTQTVERRMRVADLRDQYTKGITLLDQLAGGDFTAAPRLCQGLIVSHTEAAPFASLLFDHIVEAIYAPPEMLRRNAADRYHETG